MNQGLKRAELRPRGSIALLFVPIMGVILMFVMVMMNVAQVSLQRAMTSNSADAACLGSASWIASGMKECALIGRKIDSALMLMQAIYLVPFCPDPSGASGTSQFATLLWNELTDDKLGPISYYSDVCDGVMQEGWRMGAQAAFTGFVNNLIIRDRPSGNFQSVQQDLYSNPSPGIGQVVSWNAGGISHKATFTLTEYPADGGYPKLNKQPFDLTYLVWEVQPPEFIHYDCVTQAFQNPVGISASGNPEAGMKPEDYQNPLRTENNIKVYEIPLTNDGRIPHFSDLPVGPCPMKVCGLAAQTTQSFPLAFEIVNGSGTVGSTVSHFPEFTGDGPTGAVGATKLWGFTGHLIESSCTASFGPRPELGLDGWIGDNVRVDIISAN